jgi:hypothetical protein
VVLVNKVGKAGRVPRKSGGLNGAYVDGGPCTARGDGKWSRSRLLRWVVYRDNVELIFLLSGSRQPDHSYTKSWRC